MLNIEICVFWLQSVDFLIVIINSFIHLCMCTISHQITYQINHRTHSKPQRPHLIPSIHETISPSRSHHPFKMHRFTHPPTKTDNPPNWNAPSATGPQNKSVKSPLPHSVAPTPTNWHLLQCSPTTTPAAAPSHNAPFREGAHQSQWRRVWSLRSSLLLAGDRERPMLFASQYNYWRDCVRKFEILLGSRGALGRSIIRLILGWKREREKEMGTSCGACEEWRFTLGAWWWWWWKKWLGELLKICWSQGGFYLKLYEGCQINEKSVFIVKLL